MDNDFLNNDQNHSENTFQALFENIISFENLRFTWYKISNLISVHRTQGWHTRTYDKSLFDSKAVSFM